MLLTQEILYAISRALFRAEELYEGENPYFHSQRKGKERSGKPRSPILPETDFSCIALLPFFLPSQDKSCKSPDHVIILFLNPL